MRCVCVCIIPNWFYDLGVDSSNKDANNIDDQTKTLLLSQQMRIIQQDMRTFDQLRGPQNE